MTYPCSPTVREDAGWQRLASVWLLFQPEQEQVGILAMAAKADGRDPADAAARSLTALEQAESVGRFLPAELGAAKVFDRTSLILTMWLPCHGWLAAPRLPFLLLRSTRSLGWTGSSSPSSQRRPA